MNQFDKPMGGKMEAQNGTSDRFKEVVKPAIYEDIKQEILSGDYAGSEADLDLAFKDGLIDMAEYGNLMSLLLEHLSKEK
jgi:hypothetical protein